MYARTEEEGFRLIDAHSWDEVWLDHDLGGDSTIRPIVLYLAERAFNGNPARVEKFIVISYNPVGAEWIRSSLALFYQIS